MTLAHSGNSFKSKGIDAKGKMALTTTQQMKAVPIPVMIMCLVGILHGAATRAFGGVLIGRQKAKEQAMVVESIKYIGCHLAETDISAITGNMMLHTATLLEKICVRKTVKARTRTKTGYRGNLKKDRSI